MLEIAAMKKAVTASKAMTKGAIAEAIAASCELKKSVCAKALNVLAEVATQGDPCDGRTEVPAAATADRC